MISSGQNEKVKDIRRVRRCKDDRALLEGPHLLTEALRSGTELDSVFLVPEFADAEVLGALSQRGTPIHRIAPHVLASLTDADSPRGAVAVARLPRPGLAAFAAPPASCLYLDGVQDPGNLGALVRVAEAAGVAGVACGPGCAHPNHPRALRASAGSLLRLPVARLDEPAGLLALYGSAPPATAGLVAHGGESVYQARVPPGPFVLFVGSEAHGLSAAAEAQCAARWQIPLAPPVESLNVATAVAVTLFELRRRRLSL